MVLCQGKTSQNATIFIGKLSNPPIEKNLSLPGISQPEPAFLNGRIFLSWNLGTCVHTLYTLHFSPSTP